MTRKELALLHHQEILSTDDGSIINSACKSSMYEDYRGSVERKDRDCLSAAIIEKITDPDLDITILNFASFTQPGGGYLNGAMAQEESLCSESNLYEILNSKQLEDFYKYNRQNKKAGLYESRAIFTPEVKFTRDGEDFRFNVLTCAAPNYNYAISQGISPKVVEETYRRRVQFIYNILDIEHQDRLIAGAWGCGVFGNSLEFAIRCFEDCATVDTILAIPSNPKFKPKRSNEI